LSNAKPVRPANFKGERITNRTNAQKLSNGKIGDFEYVFQTYHDATGTYSEIKIIKFDSWDQARSYAIRNTPVGHQCILDGESIYVN